MGKLCSSCGDEIMDPKLPDDEPEECANCAPVEDATDDGMGMGLDDSMDEA